jgi:hypothetical protein
MRLLSCSNEFFLQALHLRSGHRQLLKNGSGFFGLGGALLSQQKHAIRKNEKEPKWFFNSAF